MLQDLPIPCAHKAVGPNVATLAFVFLSQYRSHHHPSDTANVEAIFDAHESLYDADRDIQDRYSPIVDGAFDMRKKFHSVVRYARQLKTKLLGTEAELERQIARQKQQSPSAGTTEIARRKLPRQVKKWRRYEEENRLLRLRNRNWQ